MDVRVDEARNHVIVKSLEVLCQIATLFCVKAGRQTAKNYIHSLGQRIRLTLDVIGSQAGKRLLQSAFGTIEQQYNQSMWICPANIRLNADLLI